MDTDINNESTNNEDIYHDLILVSQESLVKLLRSNCTCRIEMKTSYYCDMCKLIEVAELIKS